MIGSSEDHAILKIRPVNLSKSPNGAHSISAPPMASEMKPVTALAPWVTSRAGLGLGLQLQLNPNPSTYRGHGKLRGRGRGRGRVMVGSRGIGYHVDTRLRHLGHPTHTSHYLENGVAVRWKPMALRVY